MATLKERSELVQVSLQAGLIGNEEAAGHLLIAHGDFLMELEKLLDQTNSFDPKVFRDGCQELFDWLWHQFKETDNA